jgi:hypothetical protein
MGIAVDTPSLGENVDNNAKFGAKSTTSLVAAQITGKFRGEGAPEMCRATNAYIRVGVGVRVGVRDQTGH